MVRPPAAVGGVGFNPTLVRLRRPAVLLLPDPPPGFQSHAGSIEARSLTESLITVVEFQSHAGSIEAFPVTSSRFRVPLFQSHAGSIEAGQKQGQGVVPHGRFNPTLVRLRPGTNVRISPSRRSFNPTLVRLRPLPRSPSLLPHSVVSIPRWFD